MKYTIEPTFEARIYVGLTEGYDGARHAIDDVLSVCQSHCDQAGLCVTVTPTTFIYKLGKEDGAVVGLINYPRFPSTPSDIKDVAEQLALKLQARLGQNRVTVVCSDQTKMFEVDKPTVQK